MICLHGFRESISTRSSGDNDTDNDNAEHDKLPGQYSQSNFQEIYLFNAKQASHIQLRKNKNAPNITQSIPGVPVSKKNYNPETWMLEITIGSI